MLSLLLCSVWSIAFALECPCDFTYVGPDGLTITGANALWERTCGCMSIEACQQKCVDWLGIGNERCEAFTYDPTIQKCTLWDSKQTGPGCAGVPQDRHVCLRPDECKIKVPATNGAFCWGDPHCRMWNGKDQHYQGPLIPQHGAAGTWKYYYLVKNCDPQDRESLPYALAGGYNRYNDGANIMRGITLVLYLSPTKAQYIYMSNNPAYNRISPEIDLINGIPKLAIPSNYASLQQWSIGNSYTFGDIGNGQPKFTIIMGDTTLSTPSNSRYWVTLKTHTNPEQNCEFKFHYSDGHRVDAKQPTCWKCKVCGLFGSLDADPIPELKKCDGTWYDTTSVQNWYPNKAAAMASGGLSYEESHAAHCQLMHSSSSAKQEPSNPDTNPASIEEEQFKGCDSQEALDAVEAKVEQAMTEAKECEQMETSDCEDLAAGAIADICNGMTDALDTLPDWFAEVYQDHLNDLADALFLFEEGLEDSNNGNILAGSLSAANGALQCDGSSTVTSDIDLSDTITAVSIELVVEGSTGKIASVGEQDISVDTSDVSQIVTVFTQDGITGSITTYVNGELESSESVQGLTIDSSLSLCGQGYNGKILRAAVYGKVLSANDVLFRKDYLLPDVCNGNENIGNKLEAGTIMYAGQCLRSMDGLYGVYIEGGSLMRSMEGQETATSVSPITATTLASDSLTASKNVMLNEEGKLVEYSAPSSAQSAINPMIPNDEPEQYGEPEEYGEPVAMTTTTTSNAFVIMMYIVVALLAANAICGMVKCWYNASNKSNKNRYKVVNIDSSDVDANSDVEIQQLK